MTQALTVSNMPIKAMEKLTEQAKTRLIKLVEQEFGNKASLYHQIQQEERRKIISNYHKKVGFDKLDKAIKEIDKKKAELDAKKTEVNTAIWTIGLNYDGEPRSNGRWVEGVYMQDYEAKELNHLLRTIENNGPTQNLKSKIITRLTLATTLGEANVIMREVLGNGLIPTLKEGDLK